MKRRQFIGGSAVVTTGLLGGLSASFLRRNVGVGTVGATEVESVPPRATAVRGRVAGVDGQSLSVEVATREAETVHLVAARRGYPDGDLVAQGRSDAVRVPGPGTSATVDVDVPYEGYESGRWFYEVYVVRDDGTLAYLCESAPYRWRQRPAYGADPADRVTTVLEPADGPDFRRRLEDNDYRLRYRWRDDDGREWALRYPLRRSVHEAAVARERGYVRTFEDAQSDPYVDDLASRLASETEVVGWSDAADGGGSDEPDPPAGVEIRSDGELFGLAVRFVQGLRYERDASTLGQYDYNRTPEETLVAGVGDCKDKTHLLGGLLSAPALGCETAMLFQPAHVLLGVAAADVPERYADRETLDLGGREFLPVDGSIRFDVGDYPDGPVTAAYGDGGWFHYDVGAIGRGLDRNVRDWFEQSVAG